METSREGELSVAKMLGGVKIDHYTISPVTEIQADPKTPGFDFLCVYKQQSSRLVGFWREDDEAKCVENGSIVPRSGTFKSTREGKLVDTRRQASRS